ncbi:hypothetical protein [Leucobacter denitrificans]|uniref:PEP-CTERM sorting domain-containing protein n=1 Tax=Leucobacter denitrificans TaxID=683042 RepID=A0A7G9S416_9MICO|nr:hypothetical protein [Leucobacter denitrificans]QNN62591.1 hypothetical protein H9L06_10180 [Leucobacter denitrificans]
MQKSNSAMLKIGLSAVSALAISLGAVSPAFAANIQVSPENIAPFEVGGSGSEPGYNYDQWHIGSQTNADAALETSVSFEECSLTTLTPTAPSTNSNVQVLKGFPVDARPTTDVSTAPIEGVINSTSISVLSGPVIIDMPMAVMWSGEDDPVEMTFRSEPLGPGTYNFADLRIIESGDLGEILDPLDGAPTFGEMLEYFQADIDEFGANYQILGVGFTGAEGSAVESLAFGGDTYVFGEGNCVTAQEGSGGDKAGSGGKTTTAVAATPPTKIETAV